MVKEGVAFEYSDEWIQSGFSISPFSPSLEKKLLIPEDSDFSESFGVFDDSLPDGWRLTDRYLKSIGMEPSSVNQLTRLSMLADMFSR